MCDLLDETRISMSELAQQRQLNVCTIWRWANRGVRGVRLETFAEGGRRYTTVESFKRFVSATTEKVVGIPPTPRRRLSAIKQSEAELARGEYNRTNKKPADRCCLCMRSTGES